MEWIRLQMQWRLSDLRYAQQRISEGRPLRGDWLLCYYFGQPYPRLEEATTYVRREPSPSPLRDVSPPSSPTPSESESERGPLVLANDRGDMDEN